jgi:hypothetical protein
MHFILAQIATATPPTAPVAPDLFAYAKHVLLLGGTVFAVIAGLKNIPFFSELFDKYKILAVVVNGVLSLLGALVTCMNGPIDATFFTCALTALGTFLAAAGIHLVKSDLTPAGKEGQPPAVVVQASPANTVVVPIVGK